MAGGVPSAWRDVISGWAATKDRIHEIHLFGSRAKADYDASSDLDLAILLSADSPGEALAYAMYEAEGWEAELQARLPVTVDLQFADPDGDSIVWPAVQEHGELLYRSAGYLPYGDT